MKSNLPKVLHKLGGKPLIEYPLHLAKSVNSERILVVIGSQSEMVRKAIEHRHGNAEFVLQEPQRGTGHALMQCLKHLAEHRGPVLVMSGDVPGLSGETLEGLLRSHVKEAASLTVLTAVLEDPTGYGRIVRDGSGHPLSVVEQKDLQADQEPIKEINAGVYVFDSAFLIDELPSLSDENVQGEFYLTDLVEAAGRTSRKILTVQLAEPTEARGINTLSELAEVEKEMRDSILRKLMENGVRIVDPSSTFVDDSVTIGSDAVIHPCTFIYGNTRIGSGTVVFPGAVITDSVVGKNAEIRPYSVIIEAEIADGAAIGPFAHLRAGSVIGQKARVGNFVEVKKSVLGEGTKVSHLTYVGDATLGREVNIGAGCVTCNYDGFAKHRTTIQDGVFVGSGTMMVAPVTLGTNCMVAAGSTITHDIPEDSLAIARARQEIKKGWTVKWRKKMTQKSDGEGT
ncbi:MAG: bifunctional UDP-N-acetylglucosamine diphosphorylase/glucosamine-1-phosphate N-acetyltransferase GlmU [bacterium]|nr:MAG: bifunctional UDP-N-acetylglucosamine diphosphorylase/glucosamine-1-phosphate N-acetyltransferase GlmU [bacterium]